MCSIVSLPGLAKNKAGAACAGALVGLEREYEPREYTGRSGAQRLRRNRGTAGRGWAPARLRYRADDRSDLRARAGGHADFPLLFVLNPQPFSVMSMMAASSLAAAPDLARTRRPR